MKIYRVWAMPSRWTFTIKPIKELMGRYIGNGKGWIDPFAGKYSPAEITNDIDPLMPTTYHLSAETFCEIEGKFQGILFDPPYSLRQIKECYTASGIKLKYDDTLDASFSKVKDKISPKIIAGGYVISCGWNTNGFGKNRGFKIIEILLVPHGGHHNDTIVTVEQKEPELFNTGGHYEY